MPRSRRWRPPDTEPGARDPIGQPEMVFFRLGTQQAAVCLSQVAGVHQPVAVSPLPGLPGAVRGMATVQGQVVTVVDPLQILGATATSDADSLANDMTPRNPLLLLLDGPARGIALYLTSPLRLGPHAGETTLPADPRFALLCDGTCRTPDGVIAGIMDPERLLAAVTPAPGGRR